MNPERPTDAIERAIVLQTHKDIPGKIAGEKTITFPHDAMTNAEIYQLPELGDPRIRHSEDGKVFVRRFSGKKIQVSLPNFSQRDELGFDSVSIAESLWMRSPDVETAIRQARHIADSYDRKTGSETLSLLGIHRAMRGIAIELQKTHTARVSMEELEELAAKALVENGFDNVRSTDKLLVKQIILNAVKKDRIGRDNPSRTRLMLAHLYPQITKMLLGNEQKANKYRYLEGVLYGERERDRFPFQQFSQEIKRLENMGERNKEAATLANTARRKMYSQIKPQRIHTSPYVQMGAQVRYLLFGKNTDADINILAKYIGREKAEEAREIRTYYELNPLERRTRLLEISSVIDNALTLADSKLQETDDFWEKVEKL